MEAVLCIMSCEAASYAKSRGGWVESTKLASSMLVLSVVVGL